MVSKRSYGQYTESKKRWTIENRDKVNEIHRHWVAKNPLKDLLSKKKYRENNREELRDKNRIYYLSHKKEKCLYSKMYAVKNKNRLMELARIRSRNKSPFRKLSASLSCGIRSSLVNGKSGRHWEFLVGYTLENLVKHLELQFVDGMSWGNYGQWHIDHIIPVSFFKYDSPDDVEFKMCWRLENLQPLWAVDNLKKTNKLVA